MTGGPDRIRVLDLEGVKDKAGFMDRCVRDLELPDWFGRNWDALFDVLTDVSFWPDGSEQALLLSVVGWRPYASARPERLGDRARRVHRRGRPQAWPEPEAGDRTDPWRIRPHALPAACVIVRGHVVVAAWDTEVRAFPPRADLPGGHL